MAVSNPWPTPLVEWVTDRSAVDALLAYASPIVGEHDPYWYVDRTTAAAGKPILFSGITRQIDELFIYKETRRSLAPATTKVKRRKSTRRKKKKTKTLAPREQVEYLRGRERGTVVHKQLDQWIKLGFDWHGLCALNRQGGVHPFVPRIVQGLKKEGLRPFLTEFAVYNAGARLATRIDLVCCNKAGQIVLVELKTGFADGVFIAPIRREKWRDTCPLRGTTCTPRDKAILQHMLGSQMFRNLFPTIPIAAAWVLRIDESDEGELWPLVNLTTAAPVMLNWLVALRMLEMEQREILEKEEEEKEKRRQRQHEMGRKRARSSSGGSGHPPAKKPRFLT